MPNPDIDRQLSGIRSYLASGQVLQAELMSIKLVERDAGCIPALAVIAQCSADRDDHVRAAEYWQRAYQASGGNEEFIFKYALALANSADLDTASEGLITHWRQNTRLSSDSWLLLGHLENRRGRRLNAMKAWGQAIELAQRQGRWLSQQSTEPELLDMVMLAMNELREGRRAWLNDQLSELRSSYGSASLKRVDRALANYLGDASDGPIDPRQRPKFLYIPGLPDAPYHDPSLLSWSAQLSESFFDIKEEALSVLNSGGVFESFLKFGPRTNRAEYLGGQGERPSWDAFFFYRRGRRFDSNHELCPKTSAILESIELCRINSQAPEICFSLLAPGSHIMPHYGVTNSRLVLHLPLLVPDGCALNIIDAGAHEWQEGELLLFDDTYQHEAWNRSDHPRMILLMDCWNPYLTDPEKFAITRLVESISELETEYE